MFKKLTLTALFLTTASLAVADSADVAWATTFSDTLNDSSGTPLAVGSVLELGYFDAATSSDLFAGAWNPMTGPVSVNTAFANSAIGDGGAPAGLFSRQDTLDTTIAGADFYPSAGSYLAIRFYDATTIAGSTFYNTVASTDWVMPTLDAIGTNTEFMTIDPSGSLKWQSIEKEGQGAGTAFNTTIPIPVPEPGVYAAVMGLLTLGIVAWRRRRAA